MKVKTILKTKVVLRNYYNFLKVTLERDVDDLSISDLTLLKCVSSSSITTAMKKHSKLEILKSIKIETNKPKVSASDIARDYLRTCSDEEFERVTGLKRKH